jgi:hypothetical protein
MPDASNLQNNKYLNKENSFSVWLKITNQIDEYLLTWYTNLILVLETTKHS